MQNAVLKTLSLAAFLSIFIVGGAHAASSDELAPGYNECVRKVDSKIDTLSNSEIREKIDQCLSNADKFWQKRLMRVLKEKASKENDFFIDNNARMQEAVKNFKKSFESYKEATSIFLSHKGSGINTASDELGIKTLSDFVIALEKYYKIK